MNFCAFRYKSGATVAEPFDVRLVKAAIVSPQVFGYIRTIQADDRAEAFEIAREKFAEGKFRLTHLGETICRELLANARGAA